MLEDEIYFIMIIFMDQCFEYDDFRRVHSIWVAHSDMTDRVRV